MKITKSRLIEIIKEELSEVCNYEDIDPNWNADAMGKGMPEDKELDEAKRMNYKERDWKKLNKIAKKKDVFIQTSYGDQFKWEEGGREGVFATEEDGREIEVSHDDIDVIMIESVTKEQSCAGKLPGESNARWRARCGPRPLSAIPRGGVTEDYKDSEWEVYVKDEKGNEKIVKKAKSKRAATILYNKIIKSDDYYEVGMKVIKEEKLNEKMDRKKAAIILKQIGGNKFIAMTGAKGFAFSDKYMSFKIGRNSKGINFVRIGHNAKDLYDMEFGFVSVKGIKVKKKVNDVYADMLGTIFTKYTGMNVRL